MATKTSICLFYLTLSKNQQAFKYMTLATLVVVNVAGLALTFLNIFQCQPLNAAFDDPPSRNATCIDIVALYLSSAPVNIVTDLALLFLPMPILTGMRLPRNEKIILIITFSFGGFVAVVDVIRIAYLESASLARLQTTTGQADNEYGDFSWIVSLSFMWSVVEVHIGVIVACVPGIKPLVAKYLPSLLGRIKSAADLQGNAYYGAGDAQWANVAPKSVSQSSGKKTPDPDRSCSSPPALGQSPSQNGDVDDQQTMGMMDFLTTPDDTHPPTRSHTTPPASPASPTSQSTFSRPRSASLTIFDFVNMNNPRCMVKLTNRQSIFPNAVVTILFFLWGFAYGLLAILNSRFQQITHLSQGQAIGLHSAYYGAYLVAPLTFGQYVFRKFGFKSTFMVGLCVYGIGTLVFWPSAVLASFPAFLISNFIIGLGVATLETAGNPFISLCGPPEYAEVRLNISQGFQAIGTVVSPILAQKVLFKNVSNAPSLIDVQWAYLGIALFDVILALIFHYLPLPEASEEDLEAIALKRSAVNNKKLLGGRWPVTTITLVLGLFSNFCYVGGQESVASYLEEYIAFVNPSPNAAQSQSPFNYHAVGHSVFAIGRFLTAVLGLYIKPRHLLLFLYTGAIITSALTMSMTGSTGTSMIILVMLFESGIFSLIFSISLRGLGSRTKWGAVLLAASTAGGAVVPGIMSPVRGARGVKYSFCVVVAVFAFGAIFPGYLEGVRGARRQVDPVAERRRGSILPTENLTGGRVRRARRRVGGLVGRLRGGNVRGNGGGDGDEDRDEDRGSGGGNTEGKTTNGSAEGSVRFEEKEGRKVERTEEESR